jgi:hypothetical protein
VWSGTLTSLCIHHLYEHMDLRLTVIDAGMKECLLT